MHPIADKRLVLIFLIVLWLQISFPKFSSLYQIKPDFFLIFLTFYAFQINWKKTLSLAVFIGLTKDLFSNSFFGIETASIMVAALLLQFCAAQLDRDKKTIQITSLFMFTLIHLFLFSILNFVVGGKWLLDQTFLIKCFLISAYTSMAGFVLFPFFERWLKYILHDKQYELF